MVFERSRGQNYFLILSNRKYFITKAGMKYLRQLAKDEGMTFEDFLSDYYFLPGPRFHEIIERVE